MSNIYIYICNLSEQVVFTCNCSRFTKENYIEDINIYT